MNICNKYLLLFLGCALVASCNNSPKGNHGPIKLGDPSTIVTEEDPQKLQDLVVDLKPEIPPSTPVADSPKQETAAKPDAGNKPTAEESKPAAAPLPTGPGLKAEFKELTVMVPGLTVKQAGKADLHNANGAVYTWQAGNINGNVIRTTGNVTKVSQRYQSVVVLKGKNGDLPLTELSSTTSWAQVAGGNGSYPVKGLGDNELFSESASPAEIKNAVVKAARAHRYSKKKTDEWLDLLGKNPKSVTQKPLVVTLRSVMWKIDGKDDKGKLFSKQMRIDVPM